SLARTPGEYGGRRRNTEYALSTGRGDLEAMTLPAHVATVLTESGLDPVYVEDLVRASLEEDVDGGLDVTSAATVPDEQRARADMSPREPGVVAGLPVVMAVFAAAGVDSAIEAHAVDGERVGTGQTLLTVEGRTRDILVAERTALNLAAR